MRKVIKAAREKNGLSVAEIARFLNISASFYYKIENGVRNPTIGLAKDIAELLGNTVDHLFFGQSLDDSSSNNLKPTGTEGGE